MIQKKLLKKLWKKRLLIADISIKTAVFETKNSKQCLKCQKLDHATIACKNKAVCQFCSQNHSTRLHICKICEIVEAVCIHTALKCGNCAGNHAANSKECSLIADKKSNANSKSDSNSNSNSNSDSDLNMNLNSDLNMNSNLNLNANLNSDLNLQFNAEASSILASDSNSDDEMTTKW